MAERKFNLDDYVDVAERIQGFKDAFPEGSLQTIDWEIKDVGGATFIVYRAAAYRTANDKRPGQGIAWEPFPGKTPYTKDSELMNAETAAWGRAIVALGLAANRKLASRQEVRNRVETEKATKLEPLDEAAVKRMNDQLQKFTVSDGDFDRLAMKATSLGCDLDTAADNPWADLTKEQGRALFSFMASEMQVAA